eukprot:scaffold2149_cov406-Prasinococcus_capsulatus_cf.AAC.4
MSRCAHRVARRRSAQPLGRGLMVEANTTVVRYCPCTAPYVRTGAGGPPPTTGCNCSRSSTSADAKLQRVAEERGRLGVGLAGNRAAQVAPSAARLWVPSELLRLGSAARSRARTGNRTCRYEGQSGVLVQGHSPEQLHYAEGRSVQNDDSPAGPSSSCVGAAAQFPARAQSGDPGPSARL